MEDRAGKVISDSDFFKDIVQREIFKVSGSEHVAEYESP